MALMLWRFSPPQEHDEPILKHLQDIKVKFSDPGQPMVSEHDLCCVAESSLLTLIFLLLL